MGEFTEIDLDNVTPEEEILEVIIEGQENSKEEDEEDLGTDEGEGQNGEGEGEPPADFVEDKPTTSKTDRKPSRSEKRIRELSAQKREAEAELARAKAELESMRNKSVETKQESSVNLKTALEKQIESLNERFIKAIEEGDAASTVKIQNELMQTTTKLAKVSDEIDNYSTQIKEAKEAPKEPVQQAPQRPQMSQSTADWLEQHPVFFTNRAFNTMAGSVHADLVNEGFEADSPEYWEEVDTRLAKFFPEEFGVTDTNGVQSNGAKASSTSKTSKTPRNADQTVSGASRTPNTSSDGKSSNSRKNTITLSAVEVELAKQWNMTPEEYARRKKTIQKQEQGEYAPVFKD